MRATQLRPMRLYMAFQLFFNLLLWVPVFYQFQKLSGLSDPEIFHIQSIYYLAFCFMEMPTGWFADRFGYLASVRFGAFVLVAANVLAPAWPTYTGFLLHFLLIGLARSLISGAASAWAYEYLKTQGQTASYKLIEGDARFYSLIARVLCWAGVGYLMALSPGLPYWISAGNAAVALGVACLLPSVGATLDAPTNAATDQLASAKVTVIDALKAVVRRPLLFMLMLQGVGIFVLVRVMQVNLYQPTLGAKGFDVTAFGWVMSVMTIFEAFGSKLAFQVKKYWTDLTAVTVMTVVLAGSVAVIGLAGQAATLGALCVFSLAAGIAFPVQKQVLNDAIDDSRLRATLLSMESLVDRAVCAVAVLPLGYLVAKGQLDQTLIVCGLVASGVAVAVHALVRRHIVPARTAIAAPTGP